MPRFENIDGAKCTALLQAMVTGKKLIQVALPKSDYNQLTLVTHIDQDSDVEKFKIDVPDGLETAIAQSSATRLSFEFIDEERVTHRFEAHIASVDRTGVNCLIPKVIERYQQRDNFRVKVFSGGMALLEIDQLSIRMTIDNVSLGGIFCYCPNKFKQLFENKTNLREMNLSFTQQEGSILIPIRKLRVNRIESCNQPKKFGIAFEFLRIDRDARRQLVQQIYELQRAYLQNRSKGF
jgi:c-di-GMP-binding flagellar brake protein YcgR